MIFLTNFRMETLKKTLFSSLGSVRTENKTEGVGNHDIRTEP
jgi:hypothetical protein